MDGIVGPCCGNNAKQCSQISPSPPAETLCWEIFGQTLGVLPQVSILFGRPVSAYRMAPKASSSDQPRTMRIGR